MFTSWPNRTSSAAAPVDSSLIHQLKKLARLLHFCSSCLLLCPTTPITSVEQATWFDSVQNEVLTVYIQYLKTLNFEEITERVTTAPPPRHKERGGSGGHTPTRSFPQPSPLLSVPPQKLYKCMQRSWSHGIILVELTFHEERFDVKLLTLESSRLNGQKSLSPEVIVQIAWHRLYAICCLPLLLSVGILAFQSTPSLVTTLCSQVYGLFST